MWSGPGKGNCYESVFRIPNPSFLRPQPQTSPSLECCVPHTPEVVSPSRVRSLALLPRLPLAPLTPRPAPSLTPRLHFFVGLRPRHSLHSSLLARQNARQLCMYYPHVDIEKRPAGLLNYLGMFTGEGT